MSNKPDTNKKQLGILIPLTLYAKIKRGAEDHSMSITDYATWSLTNDMQRIELLPEDYEWIADQVKRNLAKRSQSRK